MLNNAEVLIHMKIIYHCFSCKKDFVDINLAKEHSKSLHHELTEEARLAHGDNQSFLI